MTKKFAILRYDETTGGLTYQLEHYSVWWYETKEEAFERLRKSKNKLFVMELIGTATPKIEIEVEILKP